MGSHLCFLGNVPHQAKNSHLLLQQSLEVFPEAKLEMVTSSFLLFLSWGNQGQGAMTLGVGPSLPASACTLTSPIRADRQLLKIQSTPIFLFWGQGLR